MNIKALFVSRLKATVRNIGAMSIFALAIILSVLIGTYTQEKQEGMMRVAAINYDHGELGSCLIEMINDHSELKAIEMDYDSAQKYLRKDKIQAIFEVPSDFTKRIKNLESKHLLKISFSPNCTIAASISEPISSAVTKLWFEKQTIQDFENLLKNQDQELTEQQHQEFAQLIIALLGFFLIALIDGALFSFPALGLYIAIYCLGILGMALVICTFLNNLTVLLIVGPLISMGIALLSGLLTELPEWGELWVIASRFLPGRHFYNALQGQGQLSSAFLVSVAWLGLSLFISYLAMLYSSLKERSENAGQ